MIGAGIDVGTSAVRIAEAAEDEGACALVSVAGEVPWRGALLRSVKRLLGRQSADPIVQRLQSRTPFPLDAAPDGTVAIRVGGAPVAPEAIIAVTIRQA